MNTSEKGILDTLERIEQILYSIAKQGIFTEYTVDDDHAQEQDEDLATDQDSNSDPLKLKPMKTSHMREPKKVSLTGSNT